MMVFICVRYPTNSRCRATHKNFSFEAVKNKGGYCIGTSQIFGSKCTVSTPLSVFGGLSILCVN